MKYIISLLITCIILIVAVSWFKINGINEELKMTQNNLIFANRALQSTRSDLKSICDSILTDKALQKNAGIVELARVINGRLVENIAADSGLQNNTVEKIVK